MENYRRTEVETEFDPSEMDINILNKKDYELYITTKGKIKNYVTYGLNYLMVCFSFNTFIYVYICITKKEIIIIIIN